MLLLPSEYSFPPRPLYAPCAPPVAEWGSLILPCCSSAASGNSRGSLRAYSCRCSSSRSRSASLRRQGISSLGLRLLSRAWGAQGFLEMIAEIFRPLLCPLPRHANLPLFYAFFVVGNVPEFPELRAGLGI